MYNKKSKKYTENIVVQIDPKFCVSQKKTPKLLPEFTCSICLMVVWEPLECLSGNCRLICCRSCLGGYHLKNNKKDCFICKSNKGNAPLKQN